MTFTFQKMMQTMFIKWLFLLAITRVDGSGIPCRQDHLSIAERTLETILESCYENDSSSRPTVIIGDYNERVYKSSIIRLNHSFEAEEWSEEGELKRIQASKVIIIGESPKQISRSLSKFMRTPWRKQTAQYFIIDQNDEVCRSSVKVMETFFLKGLPNAIHICAASPNTSLLVTTNGVGNYAPHPWVKSVTNLRNYDIFYLVFNPNNPCTNLHYDKTTTLNGFPITIIGVSNPSVPEIRSGEKYIMDLSADNYASNLNARIMKTIVIKLNATGVVEFVVNPTLMVNRCIERNADITFEYVQLFWNPRIACLFPSYSDEVVAIVKLNREVSTLEKIRQLWSTLVLILAAIALAILYLILTIMNRDSSSAMLDLTRLLIYSSILRISNRHSFRIYLTTMLIFMVISNGVFQGKIAAFLTTREKVPVIGTINELVKLNYKMYTFLHMSKAVTRNCPKCKVEEVPSDACIEHVLKSIRTLCAMPKHEYERYFSQYNLDQVKEPFFSTSGYTFCHRKEWIFANSVNRIIMRLVESGLTNFWKEQHTYEAKRKRQAMESEWSSPEYRPVKLYKLDFAFHGLALGLIISTIVFFIELLIAYCRV